MDCGGKRSATPLFCNATAPTTTLMNKPPATFPRLRKRCRAALATAVHNTAVHIPTSYARGQDFPIGLVK